MVKYVADFSSAVLTGLDGSGYPYSIRCQPEPDAARQRFLLNLPDNLPLQPGPTSLLYHVHDELIDQMKSFVVRGILEREASGWVFGPRQFIPGVGIGFMMGMPGFILSSRRSAKHYLQTRGLPRPQVNWHDVAQVWTEANWERQ